MSSQEQLHRKKLQCLLTEILQVGTVRGLKYFTMYPRGREEMLIKVINSSEADKDEDTAVDALSTSFNSSSIPYDRKRLLMSCQQQREAKDPTYLPPASPCDEEILQNDSSCTMFMLAAYSRYGHPYIWIRFNHQRLVKLGDSTDSSVRDCPLKLNSTQRWKNDDVHLWDILVELVKLCVYPPPRNPFAVDFEYVESLPGTEKLLACSALMDIFQKIIISKDADKRYTAAVLEDLEKLTRLHLRELQELSKERVQDTVDDSQIACPKYHMHPPRMIAYHETGSLGHSSYTYKYRTGVL